MQRLQSIQALRGIAALAVFVFHLALTVDRYTAGSVRDLVSIGQIGVDLFFVISGFVMVYSVRNLDGVQDAAVFLARRVWRIAPLLYILSAAYIGMGLLYGYNFGVERIVNCFTILPVMHSPQTFQYALAPAWTLGFEMAFYLLVTLAVASRTKWRLPILAAAVCVVPLFAFTSQMVEFAFGIAAYWIWSKGLLSPRHALPLLALAAVSFMALHGQPRFLSWGVPMGLVFTAALTWRPKAGALLWLGNISYSLYLSHVLTFDALAPIFALLASPLAMLPMLAVCGLLVAWLVYEAVEAPLQRWKPHERGKAAVGAVKSAV